MAVTAVNRRQTMAPSSHKARKEEGEVNIKFVKDLKFENDFCNATLADDRVEAKNIKQEDEKEYTVNLEKKNQQNVMRSIQQKCK